MEMLCECGADIRVVDCDRLVQSVSCCMMEVSAYSAECSQFIRGKFAQRQKD
jgi:hypothetical protein